MVAEKLIANVKDCQVFFPLKDVGIDLLVGRGEKYVGIQVKESRYYKTRKNETGHSWHQETERAFQNSRAQLASDISSSVAHAINARGIPWKRK